MMISAQYVDGLELRIKELQAELNEQCRLLGMGGEREAALLSKLERCEREMDSLKVQLDNCITSNIEICEMEAATEALLVQYREALAEYARREECEGFFQSVAHKALAANPTATLNKAIAEGMSGAAKWSES